VDIANLEHLNFERTDNTTILKMELNEITRLLLDFQKMPRPKRTRTFLEISGYPHYENVCSNILKFYLEPNNEHGLKDLILNSLVQLADKDFKIDCDFEQVEVHRELQTLAGNRLDLLIETENYVIGIENKIYHFLNNDLNDYSQTVLSYCGQNDKKPINIILSLYKLSSQQDIEKARADNLINITYEDLFSNIKKNIGSYLSHSNPTYSIYLTDFMKSIQNLKPATMENKVLWNFFRDNSEIVQELTDKFSEYKNFVFSKTDKLKEFLPKEEFAPTAIKQWIWDGRKEDEDCITLVHDYKILEFEISVDSSIDMNGWRIELFGRNQASNDYMFNKMCADINFLQKPFDQYEKNERLIIERFETEIELEKVATTLKDLLTRIEKYKTQVEENLLQSAK
jgi:hypothetical protein